MCIRWFDFFQQFQDVALDIYYWETPRRRKVIWLSTQIPNSCHSGKLLSVQLMPTSMSREHLSGQQVRAGRKAVALNLEYTHTPSIFEYRSCFSRSVVRPESPPFLTDSQVTPVPPVHGSRAQALQFVSQLCSHQWNFQTKRKYAQSFLQLIRIQRDLRLAPSLFLLSKSEMATARSRYYCSGIKTCVSGVFGYLCSHVIQVGILEAKYHLFYLEGRARVIKSWAEEPAPGSTRESKANKTGLVGEAVICMLSFQSHLESKQDAHSLWASYEGQAEMASSPGEVRNVQGVGQRLVWTLRPKRYPRQ